MSDNTENTENTEEVVQGIPVSNTPQKPQTSQTPQKSKPLSPWKRYRYVWAFVIIWLVFAMIYFYLDNVYPTDDLDNNHSHFNGSTEVEGWRGLGEKMYFSAITQSTVGYGDIYPKTHMARFLTVVQIMATVALGIMVLVPKELREVESIVMAQSGEDAANVAADLAENGQQDNLRKLKST